MVFTVFGEACKEASKRARKHGGWRYVFRENYGSWSEYHVGTDWDAETYFLGQESIATFGPDGSRED